MKSSLSVLVLSIGFLVCWAPSAYATQNYRCVCRAQYPGNPPAAPQTSTVQVDTATEICRNGNSWLIANVHEDREEGIVRASVDVFVAERGLGALGIEAALGHQFLLTSTTANLGTIQLRCQAH